MRKLLSILIIFSAVIYPNKNAKAEDLVPRTVIALYDGNLSDSNSTNIHTLVEMPLNHLGLKVEYYDVQRPLPDITKRKDVRGILTWLFFDTNMKNPDSYLKWLLSSINSGKKFVVMGTLGVMGSKTKKPNLTLVNSVMGKLGLKMTNGWTETAFNVKYSYNTPELFLYEEPFELVRPSYETVTSIDSNNKVHLSAQKGNDSEENSDLIVTSENGGYASSGYLIRTDVIVGKNIRQWIIDPFRFFRSAFDTDDLPKPDTTTIAGRRIYYSHIDGDGFNSVTQLEEYRDKKMLSAQVVMEKAVKPFPELPVTLTVIAADIDPQWAATEDSRRVAKEFFALPQVEAGSHTYSHPFNWSFFADGNVSKEIPYLKTYPHGISHAVWRPIVAKNSSGFFTDLFAKKAVAEAMPDGNVRPRAFAHLPFDINKEVSGSITEIATLLPKNKKVEVLSWSGDCMPWEEAIRASRAAGVQNINGGDTIYDSKHPYFASVSSVGRHAGNELQIYASASNEIPYTNEWTEHFDAYRHLVETLQKTESPIRLKPLNIYYHLYSGEKEAGINALLTNLEYARSQEIAPVTTSHFTHIAEGFYEAQLVKLQPNTWRVEKRGALQTIRFDNSTFKALDFSNSTGVIGQRYLQGSLYVYLDAAVEKPVIAIRDNENYFTQPEEKIPYLLESSWLIYNLKRKDNQIDFIAQGYGTGEITWQIPADGKYLISVNGKDSGTAASNGRRLKFNIQQEALRSLHIIIKKV